MDKRELVRERKFLRSRSSWLQKALFALSKAEDDNESLADLRGESSQVRDVIIEGRPCSMDAVTDGLADAVREWLDEERSARANKYAGR